MVDTLIIQIITAASLGIGALVGIQQLRSSWIRRTEKTEERIQDWIKNSDDRLIDHMNKNSEVTDKRFEVVDTRIAKDEEDIEDVEDEMKSMVKQFQSMCDKLSKHDYIIDTVVPEFKDLKRKFYTFQNAVDTHLKLNFPGVYSTGNNSDEQDK